MAGSTLRLKSHCRKVRSEYFVQARVPSRLKTSHCSGWFYHRPAITHQDNGREPWIKVTSMSRNKNP